MRRKIFLTSFLLFFLLMVGAPVLAQVGQRMTGEVVSGGHWIKLNVPLGGIAGINLDMEPLATYLGIWYGFVIGAVGILATVMIMWGGFKWLTSRGNAAIITAAKETIWSAIIGLALAFLSFTILNLINPELLKIKSPILSKEFTNIDNPSMTAGGAANPNNNPNIVPTVNTTDLPTAGQYNPTLAQEFPATNGQETLAQSIKVGDNTYVGGASSNFGGPNDPETQGQTGAITQEPLDDLNPDSDWYIAYRFDYSKTPPSTLNNLYAEVFNPTTGKYVVARIIDWGPNPSTRRSIDTSRAVQRDLGAKDGDPLYFHLIPKTGRIGPK